MCLRLLYLEVLVFTFTLLATFIPTLSIKRESIICEKYNAAEVINITKVVTGTWNLVEIVDHTTPNKPFMSGCIQMEINGMSGNKIELNWKESNYSKKSYIYSPSEDLLGVLHLSSKQNDNVVEDYEYYQFAKQIIILENQNVLKKKLGQERLILLFCTPKQKLFSVILSKTPDWTMKEMDKIHKLFSRNDMALGILETKSYCSSVGLSNIVKNNPLFLFAVIVPLLIQSYKMY